MKSIFKIRDQVKEVINKSDDFEFHVLDPVSPICNKCGFALEPRDRECRSCEVFSKLTKKQLETKKE